MVEFRLQSEGGLGGDFLGQHENLRIVVVPVSVSTHEKVLVPQLVYHWRLFCI